MPWQPIASISSPMDQSPYSSGSRPTCRKRVVRAVAYKTVRGWFMKSVFKRRDHAEAFHRRWHPEAEDHSVRRWGETQPG